MKTAHIIAIWIAVMMAVTWGAIIIVGFSEENSGRTVCVRGQHLVVEDVRGKITARCASAVVPETRPVLATDADYHCHGDSGCHHHGADAGGY